MAEEQKIYLTNTPGKYFLKVHQPVIVPSGFLEAVFAEYGLQSKIIPNAIDLKNFSFTERKNITPKIVSTRNLEDVYNIKAAIDTHAIIQKQYPDTKYTIAGMVRAGKALESFVRRHAIRKRRLLPRQSVQCGYAGSSCRT
jgi:glycosyltransferase involved in cell wall biosynthesis